MFNITFKWNGIELQLRQQHTKTAKEIRLFARMMQDYEKFKSKKNKKKELLFIIKSQNTHTHTKDNCSIDKPSFELFSIFLFCFLKRVQKPSIQNARPQMERRKLLLLFQILHICQLKLDRN